LHIVKSYDAASVPLFKSLLAGAHIANGVLTANKAGSADGGKPFLKVTLTELFVTSVQSSGSSEIPTESVSFSYATVKVEYSKQNEQGVLATAGSVTYDVKQNKLS
jgi:type VI secretion system secreted protein Hcp